jgi:hypothetical protein
MIEQMNRQFSVLNNVYARRFRTDLELFKCGISPLIFRGVSPNLQGQKLHPPLAERNEEHGGYMK